MAWAVSSPAVSARKAPVTRAVVALSLRASQVMGCRRPACLRTGCLRTGFHLSREAGTAFRGMACSRAPISRMARRRRACRRVTCPRTDGLRTRCRRVTAACLRPAEATMAGMATAPLVQANHCLRARRSADSISKVASPLAVCRSNRASRDPRIWASKTRAPPSASPDTASPDTARVGWAKLERGWHTGVGATLDRPCSQQCRHQQGRH